ncbi:tyrosine-protein kinase domain-containing protein [Zobellia roscoffensis]|uniref:GumC family protein n=1 Tax=Zobellia roscoffensis TaxID=2779508 RepID=UPI00188A35D1|nr:tyrosine-protein kinase domain-containing protein [Zobellia roscoffensis]
MEENTKKSTAASRILAEEKPIDVAQLISGYLRYWQWFVLTLGVAMFLSVVYLKVNKPVYRAVASVIIEDEKGKTSSKDAGAFVDMGMLEGISTSSIENEIGLVSSRRLMTNAVKALGLNMVYYSKGELFGFESSKLPIKELYKQTPYKLRLVRLDESKLQQAIELEQHILNIAPIDGGIVIEQNGTDSKPTYKVGDVVNLDFAELIVEANEKIDSTEARNSDKFYVKFLPVEAVANGLRNQLGVSLVDDNSTLIQLGINNKVPEKAQDILDQLVFEYNQEAIEDKNLIARNTAFFIDERLKIINSELDSVESGKEEFKTSNKLTDIKTESSVIIQNVSDYNNRQQEIATELEVTNAMMEHVSTNSINLLPANMAVGESSFGMFIDEYNSLVLERNRLLKGATETNPLVVNMTNQLLEIKENIRQSLISTRSNLRITRDNLRRQAGILGSRISEKPSQEREYRGIERQQNIKEALYLFLLQKREENSLSLAAKAPKAKIVDEAYSLGGRVSPNTKKVLGVGLLCGFLLPFLVITGKRIMDNTINTREDIKDRTEAIAILGEVPHITSDGPTLVSGDERSVLSESFNILTANLKYIIDTEGTADGKGKCVYVTSSAQGEGKTFSAINMAMTLAETGKKVVLIGADLRNPQLHRHDNSGIAEQGLSTFLTKDDKGVFEYIDTSSLHADLQVLPSGPIPHNPIQLLRSEKIGPMLEELKEVFDYVIVDTAPSMILADTFLISRHADYTVYMVRAGRSKKKVLEFALESYAEGKLINPLFLLNDVNWADAGYGYKYGYAYGSDSNKKWPALLMDSIQRGASSFLGKFRNKEK